MSNAESRAKLKDSLKKSNKGVDQVINLANEKYRYLPLQRISSGELGLDIALGGGWPIGRMIKIAGKYSYGKTLMLVNAMRNFTEKGMYCLVIDPDGTTTSQWLAAQGVDVSKIEYHCPETMEEACDLVEAAITANAYDAVFLDSLAALVPKKELEASVEEFTQGLKARKLNQFFRKMRGRYSEYVKTGATDIPTFFYTNHVFVDLNKKFDKDTTPGGQEQDNSASIIVNLFRTENLYQGSKDTPEEERDYVGWKVQAKVVKNKTFAPFKRTSFYILNEEFSGHPAYCFYHAETLIRLSEKIGSVKKAGAWYEVAGYGKEQGMEKTASWIAGNKELADVLVEALKSQLSHIPIQYEFPDFSKMGQEVEIVETIAPKVVEKEKPVKTPAKKGRKKK